MILTAHEDLVGRAREVAQDVLRRWAARVDAESRFPEESVAALREAGLLSYFAPREAGGLAGDLETYVRIAGELGAECLSTALIWVMHAHQLATLADHRRPEHLPHLERIVRQGLLLASVTTEAGKGGDVLRAAAPLVAEGDGLRLRRRAPVVSYGAQAGYFLITMRAAPDRPPTDVALVLVSRHDGRIEVTGDWEAMGLRGTRSVPMAFDVLVDRDRVVGRSFREVALKTLVPTAQTGWTAAWLGAAEGAFLRFVARSRRSRSSLLASEAFRGRLAGLRVSLDLVRALLERVTERLDALRRAAAPQEAYEDPAHNVRVNNLKIAGSRLLFEVADGLVELAGMAHGYLRDDELGLERVFRDLRSATLMYSNDRLLQANARLILMEGTPVSRIWSQGGG